MNSPLLIILLLLLNISLILSSSEYPIKLLVSQYKKYFPNELSTFTQYVNIDIKTGKNPENQIEQPIQELFLILDTSGSMGGKKLANAKLAIENIIKNMNEKDKLHLIEYNSRSSIIFENENNQELMLNKLKSIYASGGTNLGIGFDQTKILLDKYSQRKSLKRIFIFSDGQINEGITNHRELLNIVTSLKKTYGITICSFGIGLDFDEELMTNIADDGSGDFFFIRGFDDMNKVVDIAYKGFQALIGTNAYLKITTKNNARIIDTFGYENTKQDENNIIPIGDIRYNDKMNILLETEIKITEQLLEKSQIDYMIIELWITDINDQKLKLISTESILFSLSKNKDELNDLNKLVEYLVQLQNIQTTETHVTHLLKHGLKNEAMALKISLADQIDSILASSTNFQPIDEAEKEKLEYIRHKIGITHRRYQFTNNLFTSHEITDNELYLQNSYFSKLNSKYRSSHDDL